jgi:hypothetical protein
MADKLLDAPSQKRHAARYLFQEYHNTESFSVSREGSMLYEAFINYLKKAKRLDAFSKSIQNLDAYPIQQFLLAQQWISAFVKIKQDDAMKKYIPEAALLSLLGDIAPYESFPQFIHQTLPQMKGNHELIKQHNYVFDYYDFVSKLDDYTDKQLPRFKALSAQKDKLIRAYRAQLRLSTFKPNVMSGFVRNKLISQLYMPLIGNNLAKQIGTLKQKTESNRQGLLLLLSPPGYGKTTLIEYIAHSLGMNFMSISGPALSHRTYSLDPAEAPNQTAAKELERLNLGFELGDNLMIYIDDIQHCHPEFLQKFISLCDSQRKIEGVWRGQSKTYHFQNKRLAVVMAGNPYTESGEQFKVPDMLANRADVYKLGDIIGTHGDLFRLSYIENALYANPILAEHLGNHRDDAYELLKVAEGKLELESIKLNSNISPHAIEECIAIFKHYLTARAIVLQVNQQYIYSASIANEHRVQPPFLLQGSYRNMNRIAQKIVPAMSAEEAQSLMLDHYTAESNTLASDGEFNLLAFKELQGQLSAAEEERINAIRKHYALLQGAKSGKHITDQLKALQEELQGIKAALVGGRE